MARKMLQWEVRKHMAGVNLAVDETQDISHLYCEAVTNGGADHKKRLNIRRTPDVYLLRCNHCGAFGSLHLSVKARVQARQNATATGTRTAKNVKLPHDTTYEFSEFSPSARVWCLRYGLFESEIKQHRFGYSPKLRRVVLPVYRDGKLCSYQLRSLSDEDTPKYLGAALKDEKWQWLKGSGTSVLVLTEDVQSAIRCHRHTDALALLSTGISDSVLVKIVEAEYDRYIVFLDSDNASVKKQERELVNRISSLVGAEKVVYIRATDPKRMSDKELKEIIL